MDPVYLQLKEVSRERVRSSQPKDSGLKSLKGILKGVMAINRQMFLMAGRCPTVDGAGD